VWGDLRGGPLASPPQHFIDPPCPIVATVLGIVALRLDARLPPRLPPQLPMRLGYDTESADPNPRFEGLLFFGLVGIDCLREPSYAQLSPSATSRPFLWACVRQARLASEK
jgi:hypothetical protein